MQKKKILLSLFSLSTLLLAACSENTLEEPVTVETPNNAIEESVEDNEKMDGEMVHDESGDIPEGLEEAENPMYEVGETVVIQTDHMEGMDGAEAIIVGAFNTIAYEVSYDPTNGDPREENHRWVIHEEIVEGAETDVFELGDEVLLDAYHMEGMEGATAVIDAAENTTVYMLDYEPTTGGGTVKNHKWVTDSELSTVEE